LDTFVRVVTVLVGMFVLLYCLRCPSIADLHDRSVCTSQDSNVANVTTRAALARASRFVETKVSYSRSVSCFLCHVGLPSQLSFPSKMPGNGLSIFSTRSNLATWPGGLVRKCHAPPFLDLTLPIDSSNLARWHAAAAAAAIFRKGKWPSYMIVDYY